jgi:hypothetical protein
MKVVSGEEFQFVSKFKLLEILNLASINVIHSAI